MLLREIKSIFHLELDQLYPKEEVDSFFHILVGHYLHLERFVLALRPDLIISKEEEQPLFEALAQLKLEKPIQYIIGKTSFMDLELHVDENVLIPRPETEQLVRWIIEEARGVKYEVGNDEDDAQRAEDLQGVADVGGLHVGLKEEGVDKIKILDIGTGSGCIAIALAKTLSRRQAGLPEIKVHALDISEEALEVAKRNTVANKVEIEFVQADIFEWNSVRQKFDIIVSNPPYVRELDKKEMSKNVIDYEPEPALFVPDENPLLFYRRIVEVAMVTLKEGGRLYLEINQYLAKETEQLLKEHNFKDIELRKDLFGNDRLLKGILNSEGGSLPLVEGQGGAYE